MTTGTVVPLTRMIRIATVDLVEYPCRNGVAICLASTIKRVASRPNMHLLSTRFARP